MYEHKHEKTGITCWHNPGLEHVVVVVVSHVKRIGCQPEKLLYTVANPARGLLNREKRTK